MINVYSDGGVIGRNPSRTGGTWAWVQVADDGLSRLRSDSGVVAAGWCGLETVTNNLTELLAAVCGLEAAPDGWCGTLYTDSLVTLHRVAKDCKAFAGIPLALVERVRAVRRRLGPYRVVLLGGHPSVAELGRGVRKDGLPVSPHNVWCDRRCTEEGQRYLRGLKRQALVASPGAARDPA